MSTWETMTNEDVLKAWDAGELVWTCEQGGMGPGYEQCIQVMGFEMLRAMLKNPLDDWSKVSGEEGRDEWRKYSDLIEADPVVKACIGQLHPSGAQFGAAMNIAAVFAQNGYAEGMAKVPEDRRMMVSKNFPQFDAAAVG